MTPLQTLAMVVSQHKGLGAKLWAPLGRSPGVAERCERLLEQCAHAHDPPAVVRHAHGSTGRNGRTSTRAYTPAST